jgi:lipid-A-disaccharide synthase
MALKVLVSAGEVSGDQHLSRVVQALKAQLPDVVIRGMAGRESQLAGATLDVDCYRAGAAMGFLELFRSAAKIVSSFRLMARSIREWRPDVLVLVDYPDFNLRLAKVAHSLGIPVVYFIPPKVWAWRRGRIRKIARYVDRIAAIFPFEPEFYSHYGYEQVVYVGHPLSEVIGQVTPSDARANSVLLLPGSRKSEVERILVPILGAFARVRGKHPNLRATVLLAPNMDSTWAKDVACKHVDPSVLAATDWVRGEPLDEMRKARVGVLKSGTCNLEGAIAGLPFVCVYSGGIVARMITFLLVSLRECSPVNIIRSGTVRELMRVRLPEAEIAEEVERILEDGRERSEMLENLATVRDALCGEQALGTVSQRVARLIIETSARS